MELTFSEKSGIEWKKIFQVISYPEKVEKYLEKSETKYEGDNKNKELLDLGLKKKVLHLSNAVSHEISHFPDHLKNSSRKGKKVLEEARLMLLDLLAKENEVVRKKVPKRNFHIKDVLLEIGQSFHLFKEIILSYSSSLTLMSLLIFVL